VKDFNAHVPADVVAVLDASAALQVTEFRLFELAWREWSGQRPDTARLERCFAAYMFADRVPHWVRNFARQVLELDARGHLDPRSYGIWPRLPSSRMRFIAKLYCAALVILMLVLSGAALNLDDRILSFYRGCYFPPCYMAE
jgi:hypothetical protein